MWHGEVLLAFWKGSSGHSVENHLQGEHRSRESSREDLAAAWVRDVGP